MKNKSLSELNLEELYEKKKMLKSILLVCACIILIIAAAVITFLNLNEGSRATFFIIPVCFISILPISNNLGSVAKEIKNREAR